jgi:hypothetical protein
MSHVSVGAYPIFDVEDFVTSLTFVLPGTKWHITLTRS